MLENLIRFLTDIVSVLEQFKERLKKGITELLSNFLKLLENIYKWIIQAIETIIDYLRRMFCAILNLSLAFAQLSLFYIPTFIFLCIYFFVHRSKWWLISAVIWSLLITAIGFFYKK